LRHQAASNAYQKVQERLPKSVWNKLFNDVDTPHICGAYGAKARHTAWAAKQPTCTFVKSATLKNPVYSAWVAGQKRTIVSPAKYTGTSYTLKLEAMTKMATLSADLDALRAAEPHMHAVVFTQHANTHSQVVEVVRAKGITVYELKGGVDAAKRHKCIRDFQAQEKKPKVIVATMKTGNCGVTLTAATRVFLMEPFMDPAHEVQAAGRIHRLGQLKDVFVKRYW